MKPVSVLSLLAGLSLFASVPTAYSAEWYDAPGGQRSFVKTSPTLAAQAFLQSQAAALRLQTVELTPSGELPLLQFHTVRFAQRYAGLPVFDSSAAVRVGPDGAVRYVALEVARNLTVSPTPALDESGAKALVGRLSGQVLGAETSAQLGIVPNHDLGGQLVWRVEVLGPRGMRRFQVDAHSGRLLSVSSLRRDVKGRVYDINWVKTPTPEDRDLLNLTEMEPQKLTGRAGSVYQFVGGNVETNPSSLQISQQATATDGADFLYEPSTSEPDFSDHFAEVNLYYHVNRGDSYFRDTLGLPMGYGLMVVANYSPDHQSYENAFYTPWSGSTRNAIFVGQAYGADFAYDSDVLLHEFTHYINHNAVGFSDGPISFDQYGMVVMPGAMDEGIADYFSCTQNDDSVVGEAALGYYARDLETEGGHCPEDLIGESHQDGELIGRTTWGLRKALGAQLADKLVWGAVSLLHHNASMGDFATGVQHTAQDMQSRGVLTDAQLQQVNTVLNERGLLGCDRMIPLTPGHDQTTVLLGLDYMGQMMGYDCSTLQQYGLELSSIFQYKFQPEAQTGKVRFHVELEANGYDLDWSIYVRKGNPVTFSGSSQSAPSVSRSDYSKKNITDTKGDLVIDLNSSPPLDPASPYYLVITYLNCPVSRATVSVFPSGAEEQDGGTDAAADSAADARPQDGASTDAQPLSDANPDAQGTESDASTSSDSDDDSGCGCRVVPGPQRSGLIGLALSALTMLAVRRRRSR